MGTLCKGLMILIIFWPARAQVVIDLSQLNNLSHLQVFKIQPLQDRQDLTKFIDHELDDSSWSDFYAPENWNKSAYHDYFGPVVYRLTFYLESIPDDQLGVYLGANIDNDDTYFNGSLIGHNGILGKTETYVAFDVPRFYRLPQTLLRKGKSVVAMVFHPYSRLGIMRGPILLGPAHSIMDVINQERTSLISILGIYLLFSLIYLLLAIKTPSDSTNWGFLGFIVLFTAYLFSRSPLKYDFSHDYLFLKRLELLFIEIAPNLFLFFLISFFGKRHHGIHYIIYILSILTVGLLLFLPENREWTILLEYWMQPKWLLLMTVVVHTIVSNLNTHPDAKPMAISILMVVLTLFYDILVARQIDLLY